MAEYIIQKETLDKIAKQSNKISGRSEPVTLATVVDDLSAANDEIDAQGVILEELVLSVYERSPATLFRDIIDGSVVTIRLDEVTSIGRRAFQGCQALSSVDFPLVTSIDVSAFYGYDALTKANFPQATSIGANAFCYCQALSSVNFPLVTSIGSGAFGSCQALSTVNFPQATSIGSQAFYNCQALTALILRNTEKVCVLNNVNALTNTPIKSGTGYIYVPASLLDAYKTATNWSTFASKFRAIEEYSVDGTVTGELDPTKI